MRKMLSLLLFVLSSDVFAIGTNAESQLGLYVSSITYKEPGVMREKGTLTGVMGRFSAHYNERVYMLDAMYSSGDVDYNGSGSIKSIPDRIFEIRAMLGHDFQTSFGVNATPYLGLGYRNLNDDSNGMLSSTNNVGYEREQIYWYAPIGLDLRHFMMNNGWHLGGRIEYDYLISGINHTYLGVFAGENNLTLKQHHGYGFRLNVDFSLPVSNLTTVVVRPFYRYWHIEESDIDYSASTPYIEPNNNSRELGMAVLASF